MTDPDTLESRAQQLHSAAEDEHKKAEGLGAEDTAAAQAAEDHAGFLYLQSKQAQKAAQDLRSKLEDIDKRLDEKRKKLQQLETEHKRALADKNYKTPDSLVGMAVRFDVDAESYEKQAMDLAGTSDDPYNISEAEKLSAKAALDREKAEQTRKDADELHKNLQEKEDEMKRVQQEIESLESDRKSALDNAPSV